jgi:hypothetical protein
LKKERHLEETLNPIHKDFVHALGLSLHKFAPFGGFNHGQDVSKSIQI